MKNLQRFSIILLLSGLPLACEKTPGEGGTARIKGKVWVKQYDQFFTFVQQEYFAPDVKVDITYGNNVSPDNDATTNSNGEFEFIFLRKGKYKLTLYSKTLKDSVNPSGLIPVETTVEIKHRKQTIDLGTLTLQK